MSDIKSVTNEIYVTKIADKLTTKSGSPIYEPEIKTYSSSFQSVIHQIKTLSDSESHQNKIAQLKEDIANHQYVIDFDELVGQLLTEE